MKNSIPEIIVDNPRNVFKELQKHPKYTGRIKYSVFNDTKSHFYFIEGKITEYENFCRYMHQQQFNERLGKLISNED